MGCAIKRILQFNDILTLGPVRVFDANNIEITKTCMYSWSSDMVCWTNWVDYNTYMSLVKNVEEDMYLRILLMDSFGKVSINDVFTTCYTICLAQTNPFLESFCGDENLYNPYAGLDCALQLQQQLADSTICMLGIPIFYFQVKPDAGTADYTFKEYVLHNVVSVKKLKMMVQDGAMPSSNPKFNALDFDWETDWEVELSKTQFATAFGDTAFPKNRDFIYVPMMKRLWDVNAAYDEKNEGLMWRSTTWKLSLLKYEDSTAISADDQIQELIDNWKVNTYEDVFGKKEDMEQERTTATAQVSSPKVSGNNLYDMSLEDSVRHQYTRGEVSIIPYQYNHGSNIVARNMYKFKTPSAVVTYQNYICGSNGTLSFIIQTQGMPTEGQNIIVAGPISIRATFQSAKETGLKFDRYELDFNGMKAHIGSFSSHLVVARWNRDNFTTSLDVYSYAYQSDVPKYMLRPEMYQFDLAPVFSATAAYNNDYNISCGEQCYIQPYPCLVTNIKLYNRDLGPDESLKEALKYTTTHTACVINDLARPMSSGTGYSIK